MRASEARKALVHRLPGYRARLGLESRWSKPGPLHAARFLLCFGTPVPRPLMDWLTLVNGCTPAVLSDVVGRFLGLRHPQARRDCLVDIVDHQRELDMVFGPSPSGGIPIADDGCGNDLVL